MYVRIYIYIYRHTDAYIHKCTYYYCDLRSQLILSPGRNSDRPTDRGRGHARGARQNDDVNEDSQPWMPRMLFWRDIAFPKVDVVVVVGGG